MARKKWPQLTQDPFLFGVSEVQGWSSLMLDHTNIYMNPPIKKQYLILFYIKYPYDLRMAVVCAVFIAMLLTDFA